MHGDSAGSNPRLGHPLLIHCLTSFFSRKGTREGEKKTKAHSKNWKPQSNILTSKACVYTICYGSNGTCRHRTTLFDGTLEHMPDESNKTGT